MATDVRGILRKADNARAFADHFINGYLNPAFGARSKSEIDLLVLEALIEAKAIDPAESLYELARAFNITPTKVRSLIFNWELRHQGFGEELNPMLREALLKTRFSKDGSLLSFGIESPLLKEEVVARLRAEGVFADASFSREIVRMPVEAFVALVDQIVGKQVKEDFVERLVKDKQLPDTSFQALACGVLKKLGQKVAGEAGSQIAGELVNGATPIIATFLGELLWGKGKEAAEAAEGSA